MEGCPRIRWEYSFFAFGIEPGYTNQYYEGKGPGASLYRLSRQYSGSGAEVCGVATFRASADALALMLLMSALLCAAGRGVNRSHED